LFIPFAFKGYRGGKEKAPQTYNLKVTRYKYVEDADDVANKVSRRKRIGMPVKFL
jgi:hypothetical protein